MNRLPASVTASSSLRSAPAASLRRRFAVLGTAVLCLALLGCPKEVPTSIAGTDDEQMDQFSAQLEEIRTRTEIPCADYCSLKTKVCGLSKSVCDISGRLPDRNDFQKKCVSSQEECARFNESCSTCVK